MIEEGKRKTFKINNNSRLIEKTMVKKEKLPLNCTFEDIEDHYSFGISKFSSN